MRGVVAALFLAFTCSAARAHEVRPAYLEIDETRPAAYTVTWKQPTQGNRAVHLVPHLDNGWLEGPPGSQYVAEGFLVRTWHVTPANGTGLNGCTITIEGLEGTITDAFVRIRLQDGRGLDRIVRPEAPAFRVSLENGSAMSLSSFLLLGIEHILSGPDHLSFVLGLLLIVRNRWMLIKTVSAFTLAHSVTLAATTLGVITAPSALLDAMIGLSILFLAPEVLRAKQGGASLTVRYPWIVAFAFGLVHGMGFAGALTTLGLERETLLGALVLFNVGVEIGQLLFIGLALLAALVLANLHIRWPRPVTLAPAYAIGTLGATWTLSYSATFFGVS